MSRVADGARVSPLLGPLHDSPLRCGRAAFASFRELAVAAVAAVAAVCAVGEHRARGKAEPPRPLHATHLGAFDRADYFAGLMIRRVLAQSL